MLYLASQSPQRRQLLSDAGIHFQCVASRCDEEAIIVADPRSCAAARARCKAQGAVLDAVELTANDAVLGADTIAILDGRMIGKARDHQHARELLQSLQDSSHQVLSSHCLWRPALPDHPALLLEAAAETTVTMRPMSSDEIQAYVDSGESDGRAGAYAIQESGDQFVSRLAGDFDTVVGLHLASVEALCAEAGIVIH